MGYDIILNPTKYNRFSVRIWVKLSVGLSLGQRNILWVKGWIFSICKWNVTNFVGTLWAELINFLGWMEYKINEVWDKNWLKYYLLCVDEYDSGKSERKKKWWVILSNINRLILWKNQNLEMNVTNFEGI